MKTNCKYEGLQRDLLSEKAAVLNRLREIDQALDHLGRVLTGETTGSDQCVARFAKRPGPESIFKLLTLRLNP